MKKLLLILTFVLFSFSANAEKENFKQWTCYEHFGDDAKIVLEIGYFPSSTDKNFSAGIMKLKTNDRNILVMHSIKGIRDAFAWANTAEDWENNRLDNRLIISTGDGRSWVYDFSNAKAGESRNSTETLNCKDRKTIKRDPVELIKLMKDLGLKPPK